MSNCLGKLGKTPLNRVKVKGIYSTCMKYYPLQRLEAMAIADREMRNATDDDLQQIWKGANVDCTHAGKNASGCTPVQFMWPSSIEKVAGFIEHNAWHGCLKCLEMFETGLGGESFLRRVWESWLCRTLENLAYAIYTEEPKFDCLASYDVAAPMSLKIRIGRHTYYNIKSPSLSCYGNHS